MKKFLFIILIILFISFYILYGSYSQTVKRSFDFPGDTKLSLRNINGNIKITAVESDKINIEAIKTSKKKNDLDAVKIVFEREKDGINIFSRGYGNNNGISINYRIEVPEHKSDIHVKTVNGNIEGKGSFKNIRAKVVNGNIFFNSETNNCSLTSVNGNIHLYQSKTFSGDISIKSVNGSIKVEIDNRSSFKIKGGTLNGMINSDFPLKIKKGFIGSSVSGVMNEGKSRMKLKTVNGSIYIYKK